MNLQRMIVIPAHTFEKWKNFIIHDEKMSDLDRNMKSILNNTKLTDVTKWQLYKRIRYGHLINCVHKKFLNG